METAKQLITHDKVALVNDLYTIQYCVFTLPGTSDLSARERRHLFFLVSLVRSGYTEIRAPMGVIADAIYRSQGQTSSVSTVRTAFRELELRGYLTRSRCRLGDAAACACIRIHVERFVFWTRVQQRNVVPCPTSCDISPRQQNLPGDDRRITSSVVNSQDSSIKRKDGSNACAGSKKSAKKYRYHPIVYTLLCVLPRSPQKFAAIRMAEREIAGGISSESGLDWLHFARLWRALDPAPGGGRERTARREIVPLLIEAVQRRAEHSNMGGGHDMSPPADLGTETPAEIRRIIAASMESVSVGRGEPPPDSHRGGPQGGVSALSSDELLILGAAKQAAKDGR